MIKAKTAAFLLATAVASTIYAQVDTISIIVNKDYTTGGVTPVAPFATFGYVPADTASGRTEKIYAAGFNGTGQDIRVIENFSNGGTPTFTRLVTNTPWLMFNKDGDLTRGGGSPTPGSLLLNSVPIGSIGAYGAAFITDGGAQITTGATANPELSRKIYRYNLAQDTNGDAREEMTSLVTIKQMQDAIGTTNSSTNVSRQVALSTDNTKLYFIDISTAFGGLWTVPTLGGTVQRLVADADASSEPAVINVGGVDRVYMNGTVPSNNDGGIDYYDTSDNTVKVAVSGTALADFMETTTTDIATGSMASDAAGNLYFNNTDSSPERRAVFMMTPDGKVIKIASYAERKAIENPTGTPNSNTFRMQPRTKTFTNGVDTFDLTQVLYYVPSTINSVAGIWVFKPGDFNRDNNVTSADLSAFGSKLTVRGVASAVADSRYDLNGNNVIDWKDVKILQTFLGFADGDSDFNFTVNFDDLLVVAQNYETTGRTWIQGDFSGDNLVNFDDLLLIAQNYSGAPEVLGLSDDFAAEWSLALSMVPEPSTAAFLLLGASLSRKRRD